MNEDELDYAEMLEIPVNTVKVVKKKSLFKRRKDEADPEDLKSKVVDTVNERVGDYIYAEDLTEPAVPEKTRQRFAFKTDKAGVVLIVETCAVCALAIGIFITNVFMPNSAINTFINRFSSTEAAAEAAYTDFKLSPVVSNLSDAEVNVSESGVISFTDECAVYPVCSGTVSSVYENAGLYTVEIAHTSTFKSVVTGVSNVYYAVGDSVKGGVPVAYSDGKSEVKISMYDGGTLLNCYSMSGAVPVWNS